MERSIDLDSAVAVAASVLNSCDLPGFRVDAPTWLEGDSGWPRLFETVRETVNDPISLGIRAHRHDREGSLVLYGGGWADLSFADFAREHGFEDRVGWDEPLSVESYRELVARFVALFR